MLPINTYKIFLQMYGRYSRQLGEFAKLEGLKAQEKRRLKEEKARQKELRGYQGKPLDFGQISLNLKKIF